MKMDKKNREHGVYKYVHNGEVVYIGKTDAENGFQNRINAHRKEHELFNKSEIYIHKCKDKTETDSLETILINAYKPILNKMKLYNYKIDAPKLDWIPWKMYSEKKKIIFLEDALTQLVDINVIYTNDGRPIHLDPDILIMTDKVDLAMFCNDGVIRTAGNRGFPTKTALFKMQDQIENMIANYDMFLEQFRKKQIHKLREELNKIGYVLDIDTAS